MQLTVERRRRTPATRPARPCATRTADRPRPVAGAPATAVRHPVGSLQVGTAAADPDQRVHLASTSPGAVRGGAPVSRHDVVVTGALDAATCWPCSDLYTTARPSTTSPSTQTSPIVSYVLDARIVESLSIHASGAAGDVPTMTASLSSQSVTETVVVIRLPPLDRRPILSAGDRARGRTGSHDAVGGDQGRRVRPAGAGSAGGGDVGRVGRRRHQGGAAADRRRLAVAAGDAHRPSHPALLRLQPHQAQRHRRPPPPWRRRGVPPSCRVGRRRHLQLQARHARRVGRRLRGRRAAQPASDLRDGLLVRVQGRRRAGARAPTSAGRRPAG